MRQVVFGPKQVVRALTVAGVVLMLVFLHLDQPSPGSRPPKPASAGQATHSLLNDVANNTLGFQNIFVVGLPQRTDRRDGMTLQAALSKLNIEFIDGIMGDTVSGNSIPKKQGSAYLTGASLGSWRGHMNAVQEIVRRNLSSALILEDDSDWDIRIREQLQEFAASTQALTQPLVSSPGTYADPSFPVPADDEQNIVTELSFDGLPATLPPKTSPYGDNWDVLWVGHCGMHFPFEDNKQMPQGRVIRHNDITIPEKNHLWAFSEPFTLVDKYPDHTRAVHHAQEGVCTLGYAVSRQGARKILHEIALKEVTDAFDILLRFFCEGTKGRSMHNCLTTQPGLFHHHRPVGPYKEASDIGNHGDGFRTKAETDMVRWSVRLNADALLNGRTDFGDQFPDSR